MAQKIPNNIFKTIEVNNNLLELIRNSTDVFRKLHEKNAEITKVNGVDWIRSNMTFLKEAYNPYCQNTMNNYTMARRNINKEVVPAPYYDDNITMILSPGVISANSNSNEICMEAQGNFGIMIRNSLSCRALEYDFANIVRFKLNCLLLNSFYKPRLCAKQLSFPWTLANVSVTSPLSKKIFNLHLSVDASLRRGNCWFYNITTIRHSITTLLNKANNVKGFLDTSKNICFDKASRKIDVESSLVNKLDDNLIIHVTNHRLVTTVKSCDVNKNILDCAASSGNKTDSIVGKSEVNIKYKLHTTTTCEKSQEATPISQIKNDDRTNLSKASDNCTFNKSKTSNNNNKIVPKFRAINSKISRTKKTNAFPVEKYSESKKRSAPDFDTYKTNNVKKIKAKFTPESVEVTNIYEVSPEERRDNNDPEWQSYKINSIVDALTFMLAQWQVPHMSDPHCDLTMRFSSPRQFRKKHRAQSHCTVRCTDLFDGAIVKIDAEIQNTNQQLCRLYQMYNECYYDYHSQCQINKLIQQHEREKEAFENQYASLCDARQEITHFYRFCNAEWISQYQKSENSCQRNVIQKYYSFYR